MIRVIIHCHMKLFELLSIAVVLYLGYFKIRSNIHAKKTKVRRSFPISLVGINPVDGTVRGPPNITSSDQVTYNFFFIELLVMVLFWTF